MMRVRKHYKLSTAVFKSQEMSTRCQKTDPERVSTVPEEDGKL
jgi:hypothetical protein